MAFGCLSTQHYRVLISSSIAGSSPSLMMELQVWSCLLYAWLSGLEEPVEIIWDWSTASSFSMWQDSGKIWMEIDYSRCLMRSSSFSSDPSKRCAMYRSSMPPERRLLWVTTEATKTSSSVLFSMTFVGFFSSFSYSLIYFSSLHCFLGAMFTSSQMRTPSVWRQSLRRMWEPWVWIQRASWLKFSFCMILK